jgi:hypothetical protein
VLTFEAKPPVGGGNFQIVDVKEAKIVDKISKGGQPHNVVCSHDGQRMYPPPPRELESRPGPKSLCKKSQGGRGGVAGFLLHRNH